METSRRSLPQHDGHDAPTQGAATAGGALAKGYLAEIAYEQLKASILNGDWPPGHQAFETEIALQLGISRTPVHAALARLDKEGLVSLTPRRGMQVVPLSPSDVKEIYELLAALESMAAELVAERHLAASDLANMQRAMETMDAVDPAQDVHAWARGDEIFHRQLFELCGNSRLAEVARTLRDQAHRARMLIIRLRPKPFGSNEEHKAVYRAILAGDAAQAREAQRRHRVAGKETIMRLLTECRTIGI